MSEIRSIDELHNHYDEIAAYCHKHQEAVFIVPLHIKGSYIST